MIDARSERVAADMCRMTEEMFGECITAEQLFAPRRPAHSQPGRAGSVDAGALLAVARLYGLEADDIVRLSSNYRRA